MGLLSFEEAFKHVTDLTWSPNIDECRLIFNRVRAKKPLHIIEVGTSAGTSTLIMHFAWPEAWITSVDIRNTVEYAPDKEIGYTAKACVNLAKVRFIQGTLGNVTFIHNPTDMIYIDGCHHMPCPTLDLIYALPFCRSPFEFMSHDIDWATGTEQDGADYLWEVIKTLGTNLGRERWMGCATLKWDNRYEFARELLRRTVLNGNFIPRKI